MNDLTKYVEEKLFSDESRDEIIKALNANINIPILNENTEEKVFRALWSVIVDCLKTILRK